MEGPLSLLTAIIYALCTSNTPPPPTTAIFRTFKKSRALYKVHNMGLRYIKFINPTNALALAVLPNADLPKGFINRFPLCFL
jgi:hypothetical protein